MDISVPIAATRIQQQESLVETELYTRHIEPNYLTSIHAFICLFSNVDRGNDESFI